jgi:hypothetical protein
MISTSHSDTRLVTHLPACTSHSAPPSLFSPKPRATAAVNHPPAPLAPLPLPFHPPHSHTQPASPAPLRKPDASKRPAPSVGAAGAFLGPKARGGARRRQAHGGARGGAELRADGAQGGQLPRGARRHGRHPLRALDAPGLVHAGRRATSPPPRPLVPRTSLPSSTDLPCSPVVSREKRRNFLAPPSVRSRALDSRFTEFPPFCLSRFLPLNPLVPR